MFIFLLVIYGWCVLFGAIALGIWAYKNYQAYKASSVLNRSTRVHCTHFVKVKTHIKIKGI